MKARNTRCLLFSTTLFSLCAFPILASAATIGVQLGGSTLPNGATVTLTATCPGNSVNQNNTNPSLQGCAYADGATTTHTFTLTYRAQITRTYNCGIAHVGGEKSYNVCSGIPNIQMLSKTEGIVVTPVVKTASFTVTAIPLASNESSSCPNGSIISSESTNGQAASKVCSPYYKLALEITPLHGDPGITWPQPQLAPWQDRAKQWGILVNVGAVIAQQ